MSVYRRKVFSEIHDGKERVVIHSVQDVEPILQANKRLMNANGSGTSSLWKKREWVMVAQIPLAQLDKWYQQGINFFSGDTDDAKIIKRLLNDPEYSKLRTAPGRF